jgi:hypothetical protein
MISHTTQAFRAAFTQLPAQVQEQAREAYKLFQHLLAGEPGRRAFVFD